jgi:hypothetical protein
MSQPAPASSDAVARTRGGLLDEFAGLLLPVVMPVVRRLPAILLVLASFITLMAVLVMVGAHRDDLAIDSHTGVATAEVLHGSGFSRTLVRFTTDDGRIVVPEKGVFYPRGLRPGQILRVEYDRTDPDRVRVLGRTAAVGLVPISLGILGAWAVLGPTAFALRERQLRRMEAEARATQTEAGGDQAGGDDAAGHEANAPGGRGRGTAAGGPAEP